MNEVKPLYLMDEEATSRLGGVLSPFLRRGMSVLLYGDLGMGKSTLARAIIQSLVVTPTEVPSPTFTLMLPYDVVLQNEASQCWHIDLYRLEHLSELVELGLDDIMDDTLTLIEWPERLGDTLPARFIACHFAVAPGGAGRMVSLQFSPSLAALCPQVNDAIAHAF